MQADAAIEEVFRWRGTAEQRAMRPAAGRKLGQFTYFDQQLDHPHWRDKVVLDFGGNDGNLLMDPHCTIAEANYYCLDVIADAVAEGRERFPAGHWVHYDRYNCSFNPNGQPWLPVPGMGTEFDIIVAYSVFTHTTREEMRDLVNQLRACLAPDGALAFTFIDPHWQSWPGTDAGSNLEWRLNRFRESDPSLDVDALVAQSRGSQWCALVDGRSLFVESNGQWDDARAISYHVYYTADFLQREFPGATIRPPANGEMQHCCIIRRDI